MNSASPDRLDETRAHFASAARLLEEGRPAEARSWLQQAIVQAPSWADAHVLMARIEWQESRVAEAEAAARLAIDADPRHADAAHFLGTMLFAQDRLDESMGWFRTASELAPGVGLYWRDRGVIELFLGEIEDGRRSLLESLRLDPMVDEVVDTLAHVLPADGGADETRVLFDILSELASHAGLPPKNRSQVLFGLGRIHEKRGETDRAFACLAAGNTVMRELVTWDALATERRFDRVAQVFDSPLFERLAGQGSDDPRPIFIVGMPRSGSTLVEQIISAHPQVFGGGEITALTGLVADARGPGGSVFPAWAESMNEVDCASLGGLYLNKLPALPPGQTRMTDKRLENFEHLGLIHLLMPHATIIHCRRDPRDSCFSALGLRFSQGQEYSYDMGELGRYWRGYDRLMAHWRRVLPPGRMLEVQYEDLVADLEGWAPRIVAHCGLEWDEACLRFHESRRPVRSASLAQVREPIFTRSIGRWKAFEAHLGPLFEAMDGR